MNGRIKSGNGGRILTTLGEQVVNLHAVMFADKMQTRVRDQQLVINLGQFG